MDTILSRFGLGLPEGTHSIADQIRQIEALGFGYLACGEHVLSPAPAANAFVTLSYAAAITRRVRLLSAVTLAPLYPPGMLVKLCAALDLVSGGRFSLGVGVGGEYPVEFDACGVPLSQRGSRTDEALDLLRGLWRGQVTSHAGHFSSFSNGRICPFPSQPRLPLWVGGRSRAAIRRAARFADVWLPYLVTPESFQARIPTLAEAAAGFMRSPSSVRPAVHLLISVDANIHRARDTGRRAITHLFPEGISDDLDRFVITGTPAQCQARVQEFVAAGAELIIIQLACPPGLFLEMSRLLAEDVLSDVTW